MSTRALAPLVVVCVLVAASASAGTTGQLIGTVFDDAGAPLPEVSVSASSPSQIGALQTTMTSADGSFRFPRLAPGYYTLSVELVGYVPQQLEEVQIRLDHVSSVQVAMPPTSFASEIEVAEVTPVVDPVQVSTGQTYTSEYITRTSASWESLITQTAGVSNDNFRRIVGSTPQDNTFVLDGSDATNWWARSPDPVALQLPFDAVQEVAVHTAGFEAEFGQASGGVVSIVSKSGGNSFSGTVDIRYTGSDFESSGEHYDPNEQESKDARFAATLGGPILRDSLWFFTSYARNPSKTTPTGSPTTVDNVAENLFAKLTWQAAPAWSLVGKYSYTPWVTDHANSSQFRAAEATNKGTDDSAIASLETVGVLSDAALWTLRLAHKWGYGTFLPSDGDLESIGHNNLVTGESYGNYSSQDYVDSDQREISSDFTWFIGGASGSHEFKTGFSYGEPGESYDTCFTGGGRCVEGVEGFFFYDLVTDDGGASPYLMDVDAAEGLQSYGAQFTAAYLRDVWRLRPGLTLKLGLRWDRTVYDNNTGERVADLARLQPRAGVAWDIGGKGRSVLRASWGRFMHPGTLIMASVTGEARYPLESWGSCSAFFTADPEECAEIAESFGFGYRTDPEEWDPAGWWLDPSDVFMTAPDQTDDDLQPGYTDQWVVGFEQQMFRRTSLELSYVNKRGRSFPEDTCNGNVPEPNPDAACDYFLITNPRDMRSDYEGWILRFESSGLGWLHLLASWVVSSSKGTVDRNTAYTGNYDIYPYHYVNRYGYLSDHSRHRLKLNGYFLLPYDFAIAASGWWDSDFRWTPYDRTVPGMPWGEQFLEPRGSRKGDSRHQLDLQISKGFRVGPTRFVLLGTVINATNSQTGDEICGRVTGCGGYDFGDPIEWQQPRRYEVGLRLEF